MTPPWLIPVAFAPLCYYHWLQVPSENSALLNIGLFIAGFAHWSFLEYVLHRFVFHAEDHDYFIKNRYFYVFHFLIHGIHHAFPNDHYRIVFPPILGYQVWYYILQCIYRKFLPPWIFYMFAIGVVQGYVAYDSIHY
jgi:4-hydroxysphinganine ceramide fatty acyl 2-hydroxylase